MTNKSDEVRNDWTYQYKQSKITAKKTAKETVENFWKECKNRSWQEPEISGLRPIEDGGSVYVRVKVGSSNWYPKTKVSHGSDKFQFDGYRIQKWGSGAKEEE